MRLGLFVGCLLLALSACADMPAIFKLERIPPPKPAKLTVTVPSKAHQHQRPLTREATFVFGVTAPVPLFAGQIAQESSWDCSVTAWDGGMGCAQFMKATAGWLVREFPELGQVNAYDPVWAFQAQARLNKFNYARVQGADECNRWAATLLAYNAGLGVVRILQRQSPQPGVYWGVTELERTSKQSEKNHASSRDYPRRITYKHQPTYAAWGRTICL